MCNGYPNDQGSLHRLDLRLPPLPQTLPQVLELLHAPDALTVEDIAGIVQGDPAVLTRILKHVNSAYYGLRRSVSDVERAVAMMGPKTAVGIVVSLCMLEIDELMEGPAGPCYRNLLRHSEATAFLARYLLDESALQRRDEAPEEEIVCAGDGFTEGLLHDFGKLVLIYNYPEKAISLYENRMFQEYLAETDQRELEQLVFGCDHTEAGGYAASELNFPRRLVDVIRYHHDLDAAQGKANTMNTLRAVGAANRSTKAMGPAFIGVHPTDAALDWEACLNHPVWTDLLDADGEENGETPMDLMEALNEKREDVLLFSKFYVNPDLMDGR